MKKVRVALIGFGHLGKWHAQKAHSIEDAELKAIVEPHPESQEQAKKQYPDIRVVSSLKEVINDIDAGLVVTPTSFHYQYVKELLQADKHVFCEKPLCSELKDAQELFDYLGDNVLQVGHSERCHEAWEIVKDDLNRMEGKKMIRIHRYAPFKGRATDVDVVQDLMIHDIDLLLYLFGDNLAKVRTFGAKVRTDKWDHVHAHFDFNNGDEAIIVSGRNHVKEERSLEVLGQDGCYYIDLFHNTISHATNNQNEDGSYVKTQSYQKRDHLLLEQEYFYQSILNNKKVFVNYQDGVNAMKVVEKVLESLAANEERSLK